MKVIASSLYAVPFRRTKLALAVAFAIGLAACDDGDKNDTGK